MRPREEDVLEPVHVLGLPDERRDRHAVPEGLSEGGQVRDDAVPLLRAARREPETGDDLVEDDERAGGVRAVEDALQEALRRLLGAHGLQHDCRRRPGLPFERGVERAEVVEQKGVGERPNCFRNTDRPRGRPDVPVLPAVIAAHDDAVPAGAGPREAHRRRRRIRAGLREADAIRARHQGGDPLGYLDLDRVREREDDSVAQLALDRLAHRGMAVSEDDRAQRHREVEIPVAVDVPDIRALGARDVRRRDALHPLRGVLGERLRVGRDDALRALEQPRRLLEAPLDLHGSASRSSSTTRSTSDSASPGKIGSDNAPA